MFNMQTFYENAHNAVAINLKGFSEYVKSFEKVILWGGGYLGYEIGKKIIELQLPITMYWDTRSTELIKINGISVIPPFEGHYNKNNTLIIFCITNCHFRGALQEQLKERGFYNVLIGEYLYQGLVCPITEYDGFKTCRESLGCDAFTCLRNDVFFVKYTSEISNFSDFHPSQNIAKMCHSKHGNLIFRNVTFVINQKCTLKCKYCYSYTNSYPKEKRVNFPIDRIIRDIDLFFDAVDGVKFIPLIGGETFLHPHLDKIVKKFLEKKNIGILNVTTNGICKISPEQLNGLQSDRVQVVFSNYETCLTPAQIDLFHENIEYVKSSGAQVIVHNPTPNWTMPTTLENKHFSVETMERNKSFCFADPLGCVYVKNGRFYPCPICDSVHNIGIADYKEDYVEFDNCASIADLREKIKNLIELSHYRTCGHCAGPGGQVGLISKAGEQGYHEFVNV